MMCRSGRCYHRNQRTYHGGYPMRAIALAMMVLVAGCTAEGGSREAFLLADANYAQLLQQAKNNPTFETAGSPVRVGTTGIWPWKPLRTPAPMAASTGTTPQCLTSTAPPAWWRRWLTARQPTFPGVKLPTRGIPRTVATMLERRNVGHSGCRISLSGASPVRGSAFIRDGVLGRRLAAKRLQLLV